MSGYLETKNLSVGYHGKSLIEDVSLCVQGKDRYADRAERLGQVDDPENRHRSAAGAFRHSVSGWRDDALAQPQRRRAAHGDLDDRARGARAHDLPRCGQLGPLSLHGRLGVLRDEDKKIVEQSLSQVDALAFADAPFSAVSDGQRQRILLARALCQQPQLIVLDEPTSFLDIRYKLELLSVLKRMVRENDLAVLLSLHELDLARRISDTVICVAGDRIDRIGTPEEIFTSDYIAQLYHLERGKYDECFSTLEFVP